MTGGGTCGVEWKERGTVINSKIKKSKSKIENRKLEYFPFKKRIRILRIFGKNMTIQGER